jgi:hypothetical protein
VNVLAFHSPSHLYYASTGVFGQADEKNSLRFLLRRVKIKKEKDCRFAMATQAYL